jgi:tetratricopeptide (TPR) repeat protein
MDHEPTRTHLLPDEPTAATVGHPDRASPLPGIGTGYEVGELIASGGMGDVFRAHDRGLDREIAVKVLQERYPTDGATARRFVDEARITGRLQHPGIPPVHHVGTFPDGRPFLAMKLIQGQTLADILCEPSGTNLLATFEAICQAVGYAHAHGIVHRDLKPANVMVGAFGEVQVMDWGLAKVVGRASPDADRPGEIGEPAPGRDATQYGSVLGTPAYMPPEQATGDGAATDARSDVFGLGAVLCAILTGSPPYVGDSTAVVWRLASTADLAEAFARLDASQAEPDLVALCKRCLSGDKEQRPADATAVANEVAALRTAAEARAKQAELDRTATGVRADEERKRYRLRTRLVGAAAAALALGAGVATWMAVRATDAERETTAQLAATAAQERRARDAEAAAVAKANEVETALKVVQERTKTALGASINSASMLLLSRELNKGNISADERRPLVRLTLDGLAQVLSLAEREGDAGQFVILGHFMLGQLHDMTNSVAERDREQRVADTLLDRRAARPAQLEQQRELALCFNTIGAWLLARGKPTEALAYYEKGLGPVRWLAEVGPKGSAERLTLQGTYATLGNVTRELGRVADAIDYYERSVQVFAEGQSEPDAASVQLHTYWRLGTLYREEADFDRAVESLQRAERVGATIPTLSPADKAALGVLGRDLVAAKLAQRAVHDVNSVTALSTAEQAQALLARMQAFSKVKDLPNMLLTAQLYDALAAREDGQVYNAACCWGLACGLATDSMRREQYAGRAMTWLRKIQTGKGHLFATPAKLAAQLKKDTDLAALRGRADYRQFVSELEAAIKGAPMK